MVEDKERWKTLEHWWHQGVFLLNSALTVEAGKAGSHLGYWQWFTKDLIRIISIHGNNPVWVMWGAKAKLFTGVIHEFYKWNKVWMGDKYNYVLEAGHPAAEAYPGNGKVFTGCNHFNIINEILKHKKLQPINW